MEAMRRGRSRGAEIREAFPGRRRRGRVPPVGAERGMLKRTRCLISAGEKRTMKKSPLLWTETTTRINLESNAPHTAPPKTAYMRPPFPPHSPLLLVPSCPPSILECLTHTVHRAPPVSTTSRSPIPSGMSPVSAATSL